ncbi:MAG: ferritin-like domain-containing protein [Parvularculaceae bacterium]
MDCLYQRALEVIFAASPDDKVTLALCLENDWQNNKLEDLPDKMVAPPDRPARPQRPILLPPSQVPRRRLGTAAGRAALLHAIAHIELNAIDLAFDMIVRFGPHISSADQKQFCADWVQIGGEEAKHYALLSERLNELGVPYGDLPAHDGLWEAAARTADDVLARLAIAPLVLEARGLDVTPQIIAKFKAQNDLASVRILEVIYAEEIGHVAIGARWFHQLCGEAGRDSSATFAHYVQERFPAGLKKPFNHEARQAAGLERPFYEFLTNQRT